MTNQGEKLAVKHSRFTQKRYFAFSLLPKRSGTSYSPSEKLGMHRKPLIFQQAESRNNQLL